MKNKILVVDDAELNREMLAEILEDEYEVLRAGDGKEAVKKMAKHKEELSAVLLDLMMPVMDGFAVLDFMRKERWTETIPVLIISSETSIKTEKRCFEYGISDFIRKPFDQTLVKRRVNNIVNLYQLRNQLSQKVQKQTDALLQQNRLLHEQAQRLQRSNDNIIDILGTVVEYRDFESGEHIRHVKAFTHLLAEEMMKRYPEYRLTPQQVDIITAASALHDIGKIAISDSILLKPGKLTKQEYEIMKLHTIRGCEILENIKDTWDEEYGKIGYEICRYHHERDDGKGYPEGLKGDAIPISAQIVSLADVYDALISERVYKKAYSKEEAFRMILNGECGNFSPKLLDCFKRLQTQFEAKAREQGE